MNTTINPSSPFRAQPDQDTGEVDAIDILATDHDEVKEMFIDYRELIRGDAMNEERADLVDRICQALTVHATLEEELFYPAARDSLGNAELIETAEQEHAQARELIEQLQELGASDDVLDNTVLQLQEAVERHVLEEEEELFPQVRESNVDLAQLGALMADRKQELLAQIEDRDVDD